MYYIYWLNIMQCKYLLSWKNRHFQEHWNKIKWTKYLFFTCAENVMRTHFDQWFLSALALVLLRSNHFINNLQIMAKKRYLVRICALYLLRAKVKIKCYKAHCAINLFSILIKCWILYTAQQVYNIYKLGSKTQFTCSFLCVQFFLLFQFFCYLWLAICKLRNRREREKEREKSAAKNEIT